MGRPAPTTTHANVMAAARSAGAAPRVHVSLAKRRDEIRCGDLLLVRGEGFLSRLIGAYGRSQYTHAAMAAWWGGELMCLEVREGKGGRIVTLASQVARHPGRIDHFEINEAASGFDRLGAVRYMRSLAGCDYGYAAVLRAALWHLPVWRFRVRPAENDAEETSEPPFCSQAIAAACRVGGGVDPTPMRADRITEPGDLAASWFFKYRATLEP